MVRKLPFEAARHIRAQGLGQHLHGEGIAHGSSRVIIQRDALVVKTQADGERKAVKQEIIQRGLVENRQAGHRRIEAGRNLHRIALKVEIHRRPRGKFGIHQVFQHGHAVASERHGTGRVQALVGSKQSRHPLPTP